MCRTKPVHLLAALAAISQCAGCGDGRPTRVPVSGRVLIDGAPLTYGFVRFESIIGGRPAQSRVDDEGRFSLTTYEPGDGIVPGDYVATIQGTEPMGNVGQKWHAPPKYANPNTSGLSYDIEEATDSLTIDLSWEGGRPFFQSFGRGGADDEADLDL